MNKKIFGVRLSTYLTIALCFVAAFFLWLYVNYPDSSIAEAAIVSNFASLL